MSSTIDINGGRLQNFTIDQFAGALALILGSVGGLLMIIWKSRCLCRCRIGCSDKCYIFDCERAPPPDGNDSDLGGDKEKEKSIQPKSPTTSGKQNNEQLVPNNSNEIDNP